MEMEKTYASKGVAGTGLGLGIAGTALGLLNGGWGNGCGNSGVFGGRNGGCCSDDQCVNRYELNLVRSLDAKESENALLRSNIYTDQKILAAVDNVNQRIRRLEDSVNENTCAQAVTNQKVADNITFVDSKFDGVYRAIADGDAKVKCYVDCHFVPGKLVMPLDSICPPAMPACEPVAKAAK